MKAADKIADTGKVPVPKGPPDHRPTEAKAVVVREWAPQPSPMTREEIRKIVIDQIG
ncbi:hypothetical protein [Microvirga lotononidis]|uniref:Uncharacterized protein n=1 Tax=Microvirga lotononidis TaxID=864069 RepID=I4YS65_9HYPH|nr:hypothetical protein [Microvirga lotononidis]EIM26807.1 hypothetical protein MicloDRAFT_00033570 [Microvirga lotononidis]WQO31708.1 hypothetical protein U0023_30545 [Microvirga lotononidis]